MTEDVLSTDVSRTMWRDRLKIVSRFFLANEETVRSDPDWTVPIPGIRTNLKRHQLFMVPTILEACNAQGGCINTDVMGLGKVGFSSCVSKFGLTVLSSH